MTLRTEVKEQRKVHLFTLHIFITW